MKWQTCRRRDILRGVVVRYRDGRPFADGVIIAVGKNRHKEHIPVLGSRSLPGRQTLQPKVVKNKMEVLIAFTRILADYNQDSRRPLVEVSTKKMTVKQVMSTMEVYREGKNTPFMQAA